MINVSKCTQTYRQFYSTLFLSKRFVKDDHRPGTSTAEGWWSIRLSFWRGFHRLWLWGWPQQLGIKSLKVLVSRARGEMIKLLFLMYRLLALLDLWLLCAEAWMPVIRNSGGKDVRVNTAPTHTPAHTPAPLIGARRRSIEALLEKRRTSLKAAKMKEQEMSSKEVGNWSWLTHTDPSTV